MLNKLSKLTIYELLITRMITTIITILIYTELFCLMINFFGYFYSFLIIYIILCLIGIVKNKEECFNDTPFFDFIDIYNLRKIKEIRKECSLFGIYIDGLYNYLRKKHIFINYVEIKYIYFVIEFFSFINYEEKLKIEKINSLPTYFFKYKDDIL
jgi:hypothetical protein